MNLRHSSRQLLLFCLATWMSGLACMIYQVAWIRKLSLVTSAATIVQVLVLAAFMAGFGIGAWYSGKILNRVSKPLIAYAWIEFAAAFLFFFGIFFLQGSAFFQQQLLVMGFSPKISLYAQLILICTYLVFTTTFLGMTLPLLIASLEYQTSTFDLVKRRAIYSMVYAINTFGAVIGCLLCGYFTIQYIGLNRSILLGVCCSLVSGLCALQMGKSYNPTIVTSPSVTSSANIEPRFIAIAFSTGWIALAAEVLWIRMLSLVILNTVYAYTQVLFAVLFGISLAGIFAAQFGKYFIAQKDARKKLVSLIFFMLILAAIWTSCIPWLTVQIASRPQFAHLAATGGSIKTIWMIVCVLLPGSALIALVLPLLITASASQNKTQALSKLFAANTGGAVLGALFTGLWLLPRFGIGTSQLCLSLLLVVTAAVLIKENKIWKVSLAVITTFLVFLFHSKVDMPTDFYALRFEEKTKILDFKEGITSDVMVTENQQNIRRIWINSAWVAGTGGKVHSMLGHLASISVAKPSDALGIALGTGQTFGALLQHGISRLDCVEINPDVVTLSRRWFSDSNNGLLSNPAVTVHLEDGRAFMRSAARRYDVIVLEPLQAWSAGTTSLYTQEFYQSAKDNLRDGGVLAQWIPLYGQDLQATKSMVRTAIEIFPEASFWIDETDGILLLYKGKFVLPWQKLKNEMQKNGIAALLVQKDLNINEDLLSLFFMGPGSIADWTKNAEILRDDRPFLEYAAAKQLGQATFERTYQSISKHVDDPADYIPAEQAETPDVKKSAIVRNGEMISNLCRIEDYESCSLDLEKLIRQAASSVRLHALYRNMILKYTQWNNTHQRPERNEAIFLHAISFDPDFGEAIVNLAVMYASLRKFEAALSLAQRAVHIPRVREKAEKIITQILERMKNTQQ